MSPRKLNERSASKGHSGVTTHLKQAGQHTLKTLKMLAEMIRYHPNLLIEDKMTTSADAANLNHLEEFSIDTLSRINVKRARKWAYTHMFLVIHFCLSTVSGDLLLSKYYKNNDIHSIAMWTTWIILMTGFMTAVLVVGFFQRIDVIENRDSIYGHIRVALFLYWVLNLVGLFIVGLIPLSLQQLEHWDGPIKYLTLAKMLYWIALLIMMGELVVCFTLLMGPSGSQQFDACCCGPCCLYDEDKITKTVTVNSIPEKKHLIPLIEEKTEPFYIV